MNPKILLLDIETSPLVCYTWGVHEVDAIKVIKPWHLLSMAYKWLGDKKTHVLANSPSDPTNDKPLCKAIHKLLDKADLVVAQNGDAFDIPKINTRFLIHRLPPPSTYRTIDTLKIARANFAFSSNRLDALGKDMSEGEKLKHRGFEMWEKCLVGDRKAWHDMKRYNVQDVVLLEKIYLRLRPWAKNHPNVGAFNVGSKVCSKCGSKKVQSRGTLITQAQVYERYHCQSCGGWSKSIKANPGKAMLSAA